jgi:hypothetical protein
MGRGTNHDVGTEVHRLPKWFRVLRKSCLLIEVRAAAGYACEEEVSVVAVSSENIVS